MLHRTRTDLFWHFRIQVTSQWAEEDSSALIIHLYTTLCIQLLHYTLLILSLAGVFGFDPAMYTVDENVATPPPFVVCVRLMQGVLRDGEMVQINLTVVQGVALGGDAMG